MADSGSHGSEKSSCRDYSSSDGCKSDKDKDNSGCKGYYSFSDGCKSDKDKDKSGCKSYSSSDGCKSDKDKDKDKSGCKSYSSSKDCKGDKDKPDCDSSGYYSSSNSCPPANDPPPVVYDDPPPVVYDDDPYPGDDSPPVMEDDSPQPGSNPPAADDDAPLIEQPRVLGAVARAPGAVQSTNPLPTSAAAGGADTSGQLVTGGFAAFAGFLLLTAGFVLRRRTCEA